MKIHNSNILVGSGEHWEAKWIEGHISKQAFAVSVLCAVGDVHHLYTKYEHEEGEDPNITFVDEKPRHKLTLPITLVLSANTVMFAT